MKFRKEKTMKKNQEFTEELGHSMPSSRRETEEDMLEELLDRFGEPPRSVQNLLAVAELKALAHRAYVTEIKQTGMEIKITFYEKARLDVQGIPSLLEQYGRKLKFKIEANPYFLYQPGPPKKKRETVLDQVRGFMEDLGRYVMTDESFGLDQ